MLGSGYLWHSHRKDTCVYAGLCVTKTWTHKNTAHLPSVSTFFFQGYHVSEFFSASSWIWKDCREISLALDGRGTHACHVSFTRFKTEITMLLKTLLPWRIWLSSLCSDFVLQFCLKTFGPSWLGRGWNEQSEDKEKLDKKHRGQKGQKESLNKHKEKCFCISTDYISLRTQGQFPIGSHRSCRPLFHLVFCLLFSPFSKMSRTVHHENWGIACWFGWGHSSIICSAQT